MNIAVINIRDIIKYACFLFCLIVVLIIGIILVKNSSFSFCLGMQIPLMSNDKSQEKTKEDKKMNKAYKILDTQLAILYNINEDDEVEDELKEEIQDKQEESVQENKETEDKTIKGEGGIETKVIAENNITPSYTNSGASVEVKNQSSYNVDELLANSSYELTNKEKVVIYHTHTCESYTTSEKYPYEMTGTYRTTDLNYTVAKVR